ncbi:MAG: beta-galactosidase, partial [Clostridia bacterium]|nr:beta-galactosidase [Clostridia bacterium]
AGINVWLGSIDYSPESMLNRFGDFLKRKYRDIGALNAFYGKEYGGFGSVFPSDRLGGRVRQARLEKDYHDFYCESLADYVHILQNHLKESGIDCVLCHNAGTNSLLSFLHEMNEKADDGGFFMGLDNYYCLGINWAMAHPNIQFYMKTMFASDAINGMGYPFSVLEMQSGSCSQYPPSLSDDMYSWYMMNLSLGMKGVNYYVFAGGPNPPETGITAEMYDFEAPVSPSGEKRPLFYAQKKFCGLLSENEWLLSAERMVSVNIGFEWQTMRGDSYARTAGAERTVSAESTINNMILYSLFSTPFTAGFTELGRDPDPSRPLIICSSDTMSEIIQKKIADFIFAGGRVLFAGGLPELDSGFSECRILEDALGVGTKADTSDRKPYILYKGKKIFGIDTSRYLSDISEDCVPFLFSDDGSKIYGVSRKFGKGIAIILGVTWNTSNVFQVSMLEDMCYFLGAQPAVKCQGGHVAASVFSGADRNAVFVFNPYTGEQSTDLSVYIDGREKELGSMVLRPLETKMIITDKEGKRI